MGEGLNANVHVSHSSIPPPSLIHLYMSLFIELPSSACSPVKMSLTRCCLSPYSLLSPSVCIYFLLTPTVSLCWLSYILFEYRPLERGVYLGASRQTLTHLQPAEKSSRSGPVARLRGHAQTNQRWMSCLGARPCLTAHANMHRPTRFNKLFSVR